MTTAINLSPRNLMLPILAVSDCSKDRVGSRALFRLPCHLFTSNQLGYFLMDRRWDDCRMCCGCRLRVVFLSSCLDVPWMPIACCYYRCVWLYDWCSRQRIRVVCSAIVVLAAMVWCLFALRCGVFDYLYAWLQRFRVLKFCCGVLAFLSLAHINESRTAVGSSSSWLNGTFPVPK